MATKSKHAILTIMFLLIMLVTDIRTANAAVTSPPPGVAVLVFHQVTPGKTNAVTMSPEDFSASLKGLKEQGYIFISLQTLRDYLDGKTQLTGKNILITFDDGYQDVYKYAHPVLAEYQIPAVMFPVAMYYKDDYKLPLRYIPHLSREDIQAMQSSNLWEFGGHSFDGHHLVSTTPEENGPFFTSRAWLGQRQETESEYTDRIKADIAVMNNTLETMGIKCLDFAPPTGAVNTNLQIILASQGIKNTFLQSNRLNYPGSHTVYRVTAGSPTQIIRDINSLFNISAPSEVKNPTTDPQTKTKINSIKELSEMWKNDLYNKMSFNNWRI